MLNEVSPLDRHALSKFTLSASVPSRASLGNDVRAFAVYQAQEKLVPFLASMAPNEFNDVAAFHASVKLLPLLKSKAGKLVSPLAFHAALKFTFCALVPSFAPAGNDVRAEQFCHADVKEFPFLMSVVLKSLSDEQLNQV